MQTVFPSHLPHPLLKPQSMSNLEGTRGIDVNTDESVLFSPLPDSLQQRRWETHGMSFLLGRGYLLRELMGGNVCQLHPTKIGLVFKNQEKTIAEVGGAGCCDET